MAARKLISTKGMSKEQWLEYRTKGIGGSDVAAILKFDQYKNPMSVWLEKTGQREAVEENFKMKMGNLLEPVVAQLFAEEHPQMKIRNNNFILQHETIDCMLANIDREITCPERGKGILEVKTTGEFNKRSWTNSIPDNYMFQVQHYLAVTGYNFAFVACLIGGNTEYKSFLIERDEGIIAFIEEQCIEFWDKVVTMTMPEVDGSDATQDAITTIYPNKSAAAETVELPPHLETALHELAKISEQENVLDERKKYLQALVKLEIGNNTMGRIGSYWVTWKPQTAERVDTKRLKSEFPEVHAAVIKESESRPFKFSYKEQ